MFVALCAVASGLLLALSFPPADQWYLAWIALVPLGVVLSTRRVTRQAWAGIFLGGLAAHLLAFDWIRTLYGGAGLEGNYMPAWLATGQLGALGFCVMLAIGRRCLHRTKLPVSVILPLLWVGYEVFMQCVGGVFGAGGTWVLSLALTQVDQPRIAQIADLSGAVTLSLLVAATNGFLFDLAIAYLRSGTQRFSPRNAVRWAAVPLLLVGAVAYGQMRIVQTSPINGPTICLMGKHDLPPLLNAERIPRVGESTSAEQSAPFPDLLVWPELAYHHALLSPSENRLTLAALGKAWPLANGDAGAYAQTVRTYLAQAAEQLKTSLLIGCERIEAADQSQAGAARVRTYNSLAFASASQGVAGWYDKRHLAPFSEHSPGVTRWLQITPRSQYASGEPAPPLQLATRQGAAYRFGCALCYDVAYDHHFREQHVAGGVDFFVLAGSEASDSSGSLSKVLLRMAKLRAIENRRPMVRNAHSGYSGWIDATGHASIGLDRNPLTIPRPLGNLPLDNRVSLYSQIGDWLTPLCLVLVLSMCWFRVNETQAAPALDNQQK